MNYDDPIIQTGANRVWIEEEDGSITAKVDFPTVGEGLVNIAHTEVAEHLSGKGLASRLMRETVESIRQTGRRCLVTCPYAQSWFSSHPEYMFLLVDPDEAAAMKASTSGSSCSIRRDETDDR